MCGSCSNEQAFKHAFIKYSRLLRGSRSFTEEEMHSSMVNKPPGCPTHAILSFANSFHGRTTGSLSATRSKPIHRLDYPLLDFWPMAPFPMYKYPLEENRRENAAEDKKSLAEVERAIVENAKKKCPVVAVIVEPIQSEGGDNHASPEFFRELQALSHRHEVAVIFDEVQTGCGGTGKMWCVEWFDLKKPPDILTFSKKMTFGGYFHTKDMT